MMYFDSNATTPLSVPAEEALLLAHREHWQNPGSPYSYAARVHVLLEQARKCFAALLNCAEDLIVFNSGASESYNSLLTYFHQICPPPKCLVLSNIEHPCGYETARHLYTDKYTRHLPADSDGVVSLDKLEGWLQGGDLALVSLMAANNETGVLQPWKPCAALCREYGVPFHVDASQWLGKCPAAELGQADFVSGCAHKFGGPKGVGFLKISTDYTGYVASYGGQQEGGHRAGTENYPSIAAMLAALESREGQMLEANANWQDGRAVFEDMLRKNIPGLRIVGENASRLNNTSMLIMPIHKNVRWVSSLDKMGFCVSTGSACATGKEGPSHVLSASGFSDAEAQRAVRVSALWHVQRNDWAALAAAFVECYKRFQEESDSASGNEVIEIS